MAVAAKAEAEPTPRERLGAAGSACNYIEGDLRRLRDLYAQNETELDALLPDADDAEERLVAAREAGVKYGVARLLGRAVPDDVETEEQAEARLDEVQRAIASRRKIRTELADAITVTEHRLEFARMTLQTASIALVDVAPQVDAWMAWGDRIEGERADWKAVGHAIGPVHMPSRYRGWDTPEPYRGADSRPTAIQPAHPVAPAWEEAMERIKAGDPNAELPDVE
jgi:hypothetical protein